MKKISLVVSKPYLRNKVFDLNDSDLNQDNRIQHTALLKQELFKRGYDLSTHDINRPEESSLVIYSEIPENEVKDEKAFLILLEAPATIERNWNIDKHKSFIKIFTYNDYLLSLNNLIEKKYIKIIWPALLSVPELIPFSTREKEFVMVCANKYSYHPFELYSERRKIIRFFEKRMKNELDLFGFGWDKPPQPTQYLSIEKKLRKLLAQFSGRFFWKNPSNYLGILENKKEVLKKYKFCFVTENISNINGYVTEKIWECLSFGVIPIYLGAPDIEKLIPNDVFIDLRKFDGDYESLLGFIHNSSEHFFNEYLVNAKNFMENTYEDFSLKNYVKPIINEIEKLC